MSTADARLTWKSYAGLFLVTFATLMFQVLLTRIFSVTMWYHFAFMAISVAMFGLTVGALIVYLRPRFFHPERAAQHIALSTLLFAVTSILAFFVHANVPFRPEASVQGLLSVVVTYSVIAVPFIFSGLAVTLALTKFPRQVSSLYAVDLVGASLGCVAVVFLLEVTDGPTAVFVVAGVTALSALCFAMESGRRSVAASAGTLFALVAIYSAVATYYQARQQPLLTLRFYKDQMEHEKLELLYDQWNAYSNVKVLGNEQESHSPMGWGISAAYPGDRRIPQVHMLIDNSAGTIITNWDGQDPDMVDYLRWDVVNLAHHLRDNAEVLVIGVGGGRDLLAALSFGQKHVTGVEINRAIISMLRGRFFEFSGRLAAHPRVTLINDEARAYLARTPDQFDIIQVSLIDTWAATAAGAFVLSESALYTLEAWELFLERLRPGGILTFSRWYYTEKPAESWRLVALASQALKDRGIENPRLHMLGATSPFRWTNFQLDYSVMTLLVSNDPFTEQDIARFRATCEQMGFTVVLAPDHAADDTFAMLTSPGDNSDFFAGQQLNIAPPTDDNAFFFHMIRFRDIFNRELMNQGVVAFNNKALTVLGLLLITVIGLTLLCVFVPLWLTTERGTLSGALPHFLYFGGIGAGFMLVEISQLQRLNIFLGHPVYSLGVVLFALLLSSGVGSFLTAKVTEATVVRVGTNRLALLLALLALFGILTPSVIDAFEASPTWLRLLVATAIVFPIGLFMGMAFPLGMKMAERQKRDLLTPWLWGINGAFSVVASVVVVCIAIFFGVTAAFWTGFAAYAFVFGAFLMNARTTTSA